MGTPEQEMRAFYARARGVGPYLRFYSPRAVKAYLHFLLLAHDGLVEASYRELKQDLDIGFRGSRGVVRRTVAELALGVHPAAPPLIEIVRLGTGTYKTILRVLDPAEEK